jgi:hypothetical protein
MKYLTMILLTFLLTSCGTIWTRPYDKSESDFYNDDNECRAVSLRNTQIQKSTFYDNCMRGKGYR